MSTFKENQDPRYEKMAGSPVFQTAICECPDINASTMAVDVTGRYTMISSRKCMGLVDLNGDSQLSDGDNKSVISQQSATQSNQTKDPITKQGPPSCKRFVRQSKYEPTSSHFSRHSADLYALSTYQIVEVYSIEDLNPNKPKLTLRGHSRAISDIEWSHTDPYLLGSSGADCLTNLWDIRDSRRPSACLTSVSGATQVRFCKTSPNLVATSHEIDLRIWDIRQPNLPLYYMAAHLQKINSMDWNPTRNNCDNDQLITCSQDNTIKLWDLSASKISKSATLVTRSPAWRIRYTPVSPYAILTSTLPQLRSRAECMALKLWSMKSSRYEQRKLELILGLVGHNDVIIDFDWRASPDQSSGSCEIVSWSKDHTLRVWRVDNQFIEMNVDSSDYEAECDTQVSADQHQQDQTPTNQRGSCISPNDLLVGDETISKSKSSSMLNSPNRGQKGQTSKQSERPDDDIGDIDDPRDDRNEDEDDDDVNDNDSSLAMTSHELRQEFNLINKSIPNVEFEELNSLRRVCLVVARSKTITCRLRLALPPNYPHSECPTFTIIDSDQFGAEALSKDTKDRLINLLNETAKTQLSRSRNCIEPCLRKFIAALQKITSHHHAYRKRSLLGSGSGSSPMGSIDYKEDPITLSAQRDHSIPFPSTSGARFCGNLLVCFGRPLLPTVNNSSGSILIGDASGLGGGDGTMASSNSSTGKTTGSDMTSFSVETPRSMAQLCAQLDNMRRQGSYNLSNISISYFYYGAMRRAEMQSRTSSASNHQQRNQQRSTTMSSSSGFGGSPSRSSQSTINANSSTSSSSSKYHLSSRSRANTTLGAHSMLAKNFKCGPVIVYDVSNLHGGLSKELAENYVFDKDVIKMCRRNAEIAAAHNRRDLVQIWSLAELSSEGVLRSYRQGNANQMSRFQDNTDMENPVISSFMFNSSNDSDFGDRSWAMHPFGSKLIQSLIDHYVYNCHDVQTAAMLVWTFSSPKQSNHDSHYSQYNHHNHHQQLKTLDAQQNNSYKQLTSSSSTRTTLTNGSNSNTSTSRDPIGASGGGANGIGKTYSEALSSNGAYRNNLLTGFMTSMNDNRSNMAFNANDANSDEWSFVNGPLETQLYSNSWSNSTNNINDGSQLGELRAPAPPTAGSSHDSRGSGVGDDDPNGRLMSLMSTMINGASNNNNNNSSSGNNFIIDSLEQCFFPKLNISNPDRSLQNDLIMHVYAELLYRMNLLNQRAMVLKNIGSSSAYSEIFGDKQAQLNDVAQERLPAVSVQCNNVACRNKCRQVQCNECKKYSFYCSVCRLPVKGSCSICLKCLHGGHVNHFSAWFQTYDFCPTGCGCKCPTVTQGY